MTNPNTNARAYLAYNLNGVPTYMIDGKRGNGGGGPRANAKEVYERFNRDLENDLETPAEAHISVDASLHDQSVRVHAAVKDVAGDSKDLKLHIALVEKELRYNGENGIRFHPMVVRAIKGFDRSEERRVGKECRL